MRKLILIAGLELYALALAWLQSLAGVRTDEAKYLLDIPYPHPPLARWVFSMTDSLGVQEWMLRIILATLVVQAVWLVWSLCADLPRKSRLALCVMWLASGAVVLQAGSIMMAPLTGLHGLLFVWLWMRPGKSSAWAALLWFCALFTAYQGVLYLPLLLAILRRSKLSWVTCLLIAGIPMGLAALYALSNPLSLASFVNAGTDNQGKDWMLLIREFNATLAIGGSIFLVAAGILGMERSKSWPLFLTFLLLSVYNFASVHLYYAILFTPVLIAGSSYFLKDRTKFAWPLAALTVIGTILVFVPFHPQLFLANTRIVIDQLNLEEGRGDLVIEGSFGHDWQYESPVPVRRLTPETLKDAQAVVCLLECSIDISAGWLKVPNSLLEAYKRIY